MVRIRPLKSLVVVTSNCRPVQPPAGDLRRRDAGAAVLVGQRREAGAVDVERVAEVVGAVPFGAALERVVVPDALQRAADGLVVALVDQVAAEAADLLVGQHARVGGLEQHVVARVADRRQVGHFAVVLVGADLEQRAAPDAGVGAAVAGAALLAGAVARVGDVALAAAADLGRVAQVGEADQVRRGRRPAALGEALVLRVVHRAHELVGIERRHVVLAIEVAVAAEEPRLVAEQRSAEREGGVLVRELLAGRVLVLRHEVAVLEEVVAPSRAAVAARLGDDVRDQAGRADVLRRNARR